MAKRKPKKPTRAPKTQIAQAAPEQAANPAKSALMREIAVADPRFGFGFGNFYTRVNYNPDDLIAKKGLKIYSQMRNDEQIKAALLTKKLGAIAAGWEIIVDDENGDSKLLDEQKRFIEFSFAEMEGTVEKFLLNALTALDYGFSLTEPVYKPLDYGEFKGKIVLKALKVRRPEQIEFETDQYGNLTENGVRQGNQELPANRFAIYTYRKEFENFYGTSDLREAYRCYSDDTEILTESGWKPHATLSKADMVATLNPSTDRLEYHNPTRLYAYPYRGKMFHQSGRFIDLCVTPNHRMWAAQLNSKSYGFIEAQHVSRHVKYKRNAEWVGSDIDTFILPAVQFTQRCKTGTGVYETVVVREIPEKPIAMDAWLRFLGVYIAEGSCGRYGKKRQAAVCITQNEGKKFETIKAWADDCGFTYCVKTDKRSAKRTIEITDLRLQSYLSQLGKSHDKFIPQEFKRLSPRQLKILWQAMMLGDGNGDTYFTISKRLADDMSEVVFKMGCAATVYSQTQDTGFGVRTIWKVSANTRAIDGARVNEHKDNREWLDYDGNVYCLEVPNHIVYVRRNGKACWSGNSWFVKDNLIKFMAMCMERYGQPIPIATTQTTLSDTDKAQLLTILQNLQPRTALIIPSTITLDFASPGEGAQAAFEPIMKQLDQWISMAILMPSLIGAGGGQQDVGSNARAETEFDTFLWVLEQLRKDLQEFINDRIVKVLIDLNYEVEDGVYPQFRFKELTHERKMAILDKYDKAMTGKAITKTAEDEEWYRSMADFPELTEGEVAAGTREAQERDLKDQVDQAGKMAKLAPKPVAKPFEHREYHAEHDQQDHGNRGGALVDKALKQGGFTYNPIRFKGRTPPKNGFALSVAKNTEKVVALDYQTRDEVKAQLKAYVRQHWDKIKSEGNFLGGWIDNGKLYLDISNVVKDKNEAIAKARKADQLAIFDLGKGETVQLKKAA